MDFSLTLFELVLMRAHAGTESAYSVVEGVMAFPNITARLTNNGTRKLPGYTEPHERICKRTDIDVAFTSEYSKGYRIHGLERKGNSSVGGSEVDPHACGLGSPGQIEIRFGIVRLSQHEIAVIAIN